MGDTERSSHGGVVFEFVRFSFLCYVRKGLLVAQLGLHAFRRLAVSGSIIARKSFASWLTLGPTSPAPIRMTMLLGARFVAPGPLEVLLTGTCVRFLLLRFAMAAKPI
jgi:hypothetical protein